MKMNELRLFDPLALDPFEDSFRSLMRPWRSEAMEAAPKIRLDLIERDDSYAVKAEIPGVRKEDIDIRVDGNLVTISAEMKKEKEEKKEGRVLRRERQEGYASRSFTLACPVDDGKAEAKFVDGVLELTLPKKAPTSTKRLTVK
jgi:HSP20 family protein